MYYTGLQYDFHRSEVGLLKKIYIYISDGFTELGHFRLCSLIADTIVINLSH